MARRGGRAVCRAVGTLEDGWCRARVCRDDASECQLVGEAPPDAQTETGNEQECRHPWARMWACSFRAGRGGRGRRLGAHLDAVSLLLPLLGLVLHLDDLELQLLLLQGQLRLQGGAGSGEAGGARARAWAHGEDARPSSLPIRSGPQRRHGSQRRVPVSLGPLELDTRAPSLLPSPVSAGGRPIWGLHASQGPWRGGGQAEGPTGTSPLSPAQGVPPARSISQA